MEENLKIMKVFNILKKTLNKELIKFKKPKIGEKNIYNLNKTKVSIEVIKNFNEKIKKNDNSTSAILDGSIVNNKGQKVISFGEVIKTKTLEIFCKNFKIKNKLAILKVSKKIKFYEKYDIHI